MTLLIKHKNQLGGHHVQFGEEHNTIYVYFVLFFENIQNHSILFVFATY